MFSEAFFCSRKVNFSLLPVLTEWLHNKEKTRVRKALCFTLQETAWGKCFRVGKFLQLSTTLDLLSAVLSWKISKALSACVSWRHKSLIPITHRNSDDFPASQASGHDYHPFEGIHHQEARLCLLPGPGPLVLSEPACKYSCDDACFIFE